MRTFGDLIKEAVETSVDRLNGSPLTTEYLVNSLYRKDRFKKIWNKNAELPAPKKKNKKQVSKHIPSLTSDEYKVLNAVCDVHSITIYDILGTRRSRVIVDARTQAMAIFYVYLFYAYTRTAKVFGKDHSTVIHAVNNTKDLSEIDSNYAAQFSRTIEAVRRAVPHLFEVDTELSNKYKQQIQTRKHSKPVHVSRGVPRNTIKVILNDQVKTLEEALNSEEVN